MDNQKHATASPGHSGAMSFEDLPPEWPTRPVTDPAITYDLLDLCVSERLRATGGFGVLACHPDGRLAQPISLDGPLPRFDPEACQDIAWMLVQGVQPWLRPRREGTGDDVTSPGGVLVAVARRFPLEPTLRDHRLADAIESTCGDSGIAYLGTFIVTARGAACVTAPGETRAPVEWTRTASPEAELTFPPDHPGRHTA